VLWYRLAGEAARAELLAAVHGFEATGDRLGQDEAIAWLALSQGGAEERSHVAGEAARSLEAPLAVRLRFASALHLLLTDQWARANELLDEVLAVAEAGGEPWLIRTAADELQLLFAIVPGGVGRFERLLACVERLPEAERPLDARLRLQATLAVWRGHQAEALAQCAALAELLEHDGQITMTNLSVLGILAVAFGMDGSREADPPLAEVLSYLEHQRGGFARSVRVSYLFLAARTALLRGDLAETRRVSATIVALSRDSHFPYVRALNHILAGRIALAEGRLDDASSAFADAAAMQAQTRFTVLYGDAPLLLATVAAMQGRQAESLELLSSCLRFYVEEDLPGLLVWQGPVVAPALRLAAERGIATALVRRALAAFGELLPEPTVEGGVYVPTTGELLSAREIEVLRLVAAGASNPTIAAQLVISPHTAKHHVSNLLAKLGVTSRAAAVSVAHELGLLDGHPRPAE
jgi:ATP/maltotriose-dependent transcriptional regulator MalT